MNEKPVRKDNAHEEQITKMMTSLQVHFSRIGECIQDACLVLCVDLSMTAHESRAENCDGNYRVLLLLCFSQY